MSICKQKFNIPVKALLCFALILTLLFMLVAQPASAVAISTTVAIISVCAVVLAACGVVINAPTGQSVVDYLTPRVEQYANGLGYNSITGWIEGESGQTVTVPYLFSAINNAIKIPGGIYNALVTWANSFVEDNGIVSGGNAVGQPGSAITINVKNPSGQYASYTGTFTAAVTSDNSFNILYNQWKNLTWYNGTTYWDQNAFVILPMSPGTYDVTVSWVQGSNGNINPGTTNYAVNFYSSTSSTSVTHSTILSKTTISGSGWNAVYRITVPNGDSYLAYNLPFSHRGGNPIPIFDGTQSFSFSDADFMTDPGTMITPSANVSVPEPVGVGQNGIVSVPDIDYTKSNDDIANDFLDKAAQPGGLTATPDATGYEVPEGYEWLYDQLDDINGHLSEQNPHTDWIPNHPFNFRLYDIWHYVTEWLQSWSQGLQTFLTLKNLSIPAQFTGIFYGVFVAAVVIGIWRRFFE